MNIMAYDFPGKKEPWKCAREQSNLTNNESLEGFTKLDPNVH